jgi:transposase
VEEPVDHFWLTDELLAKIAPHLPVDTRVKERVNDRRVIGGIVRMLKNGGRWADAPRDDYDLKKTLYNRFVRWACEASDGLTERVAQIRGVLPSDLQSSPFNLAEICSMGLRSGLENGGYMRLELAACTPATLWVGR